MKNSLLMAGLSTLAVVSSGCASAGRGGATPTPSPTPVQRHGRLAVAGNKIVDQAGVPVQLVGMSLFWSVWGGERYFTKEVVNWLVSDWKCSLVRAPVAVEPRGGILDNAGPTMTLLHTVVDAAIANGVYVIIDWHEEHADQHLLQAQAFFEDVAKSYGDKPNVIFEIWNEPAGVSEPIPTWPEIRAYADNVIPVIRKHSPNLIVVGTPEWSQCVDQAANNPVSGTNVAYTLHFYAGSHGKELRDKADYALAKGIALFITEWGTSIADGGNADKRVYTEAAGEWLAWAKQNKISWANWSVINKGEASSILRLPSGEKEDWSDFDPDKGGWPVSALSESGRWVREQIARLCCP